MIYSWPQLKKIEFYEELNKSYNLLINATFYKRFILSMTTFTTYLKLHPLKRAKVWLSYGILHQLKRRVRLSKNCHNQRKSQMINTIMF